jgi:hypothetical protein
MPGIDFYLAIIHHWENLIPKYLGSYVATQ